MSVSNAIGDGPSDDRNAPIRLVPQPGGRMMTSGEARRIAKAWIDANVLEWPGIVAAHFVGGITSMADNAPFPAYKDVDLHLIFESGGPTLAQSGPFMNMIEVEYQGVSIEAGVRHATEYRSVDAILRNPEIAYHLTTDSVLYDPTGFLRGMQEEIRREYPRRRWVLARVEHERVGLMRAMGMRPMVLDHFGPLSELTLLGYGMTFITALLSVAELKSPRIGSGAMVHLRNALERHDRLDLYDEMLEMLGVRRMQPAQVEGWLWQAAEAFDVAVDIRKTPHPFQHKLHRHLRPYLIESSRAMIDAGCHREAMPWISACYAGATDVLLADGPDADKPRWILGRDRMLFDLGSETTSARTARFEQAHRLYDRFFRLAAEIIERNPHIVD